APERAGSTQILKAIPEAFVSSQLYLAEMDLPSSLKLQTGNKLWPPKRDLLQNPQNDLLDTQQTVVDEHITVADFAAIEEDDNALDPRLALVAVGGASQFNLRRRLTRIGRNHDNDIMLNSDRVSRYHAEIVREGDTFKVIDQQSRNGV